MKAWLIAGACLLAAPAFAQQRIVKVDGSSTVYPITEAVAEEFQKATPYNKAFYETMFMVKDFWATEEYAELLDQMNKRLHPFIVGNKGTAEEALNGLANDWETTFKKYKRYK